MAAPQLMRFHRHLIHQPAYHQISNLSARWGLQFLHLRAPTSCSFSFLQCKTFIDWKPVPRRTLGCNDWSGAKTLQASIITRTYNASEKFNPSCFKQLSSRCTLTLPIKNTCVIKNFSTSAVRGTEQDKNKGKVKKQSFFHFLSLKSFLSTPTPFMVYGISGLIPFISVPVYMFSTSYCSTLAHIQLVYGACILSFLGGVPWGKDLMSPADATYKSLGYSVFLPLVGWVGVLVHPNILAFPIVMSGIAFAGYVDTQLMDYSDWFKNLRFLLTSLVTLSLLGTFLLSFNIERKK